MAGNSSSPFGADKELALQAGGILRAIIEFRAEFADVLPPSTIDAIDRFEAGGGEQIARNEHRGDALLTRTTIVKLIGFESEVSYTLRDPAEQIRGAAELAFAHLKRLIVADEDARRKWQAAYATHEPACEKLGGVHLLWHGIWAFKVDAAGARTDLVYQEPVDIEQAGSPLGIVLTEWKLAKSGDDPATKFAEARAQANLYVEGALAGLELVSHRYAVLVSEGPVATPGDIQDDGVTYRHINIPVVPISPSVASRKATS